MEQSETRHRLNFSQVGPQREKTSRVIPSFPAGGLCCTGYVFGPVLGISLVD